MLPAAGDMQSSRSSLPTSFQDGSDNRHEGGPTLVADQACAGYRYALCLSRFADNAGRVVARKRIASHPQLILVDLLIPNLRS